MSVELDGLMASNELIKVNKDFARDLDNYLEKKELIIEELNNITVNSISECSADERRKITYAYDAPRAEFVIFQYLQKIKLEGKYKGGIHIPSMCIVDPIKNRAILDYVQKSPKYINSPDVIENYEKNVKNDEEAYSEILKFRENLNTPKYQSLLQEVENLGAEGIVDVVKLWIDKAILVYETNNINAYNDILAKNDKAEKEADVQKMTEQAQANEKKVEVNDALIKQTKSLKISFILCLVLIPVYFIVSIICGVCESYGLMALFIVLDIAFIPMTIISAVKWRNRKRIIDGQANN